MVLVIIPCAKDAIIIIDFKDDCYRDEGGHSHRRDYCTDEAFILVVKVWGWF